MQSGILKKEVTALLAIALLSPLLSAYKASDVMTDVGDDRDCSISGRVVDQDAKPIADVTVQLWETNGDLTLDAKTNNDGAFKFLHKNCGKLCLEVLPDRKLKLASALLENLPGGETRKMIVELKRGFLVTGRVVHGKKGLKDLLVRVKPVNAKDARARVHGGGTTETEKNGSFDLVLTAGEKKLQVINDKYPNFAKHEEKVFTVTEDMHLGKIELLDK